MPLLPFLVIFVAAHAISHLWFPSNLLLIFCSALSLLSNKSTLYGLENVLSYRPMALKLQLRVDSIRARRICIAVWGWIKWCTYDKGIYIPWTELQFLHAYPEGVECAVIPTTDTFMLQPMQLLYTQGGVEMAHYMDRILSMPYPACGSIRLIFQKMRMVSALERGISVWGEGRCEWFLPLFLPRLHTTSPIRHDNPGLLCTLPTSVNLKERKVPLISNRKMK